LFILMRMNVFKTIFLIILMQGSTLYAQDIMDYTWKNRILILYGHEDNFHEVESAFKLIKENTTNFKERDLLVLLYKDGTFLDTDKNKVVFKGSSTLTTYNDGYILIGKDGGIKFQKPYPLNIKQLFDRIDSMPMRRAEMKSNN